MSMKEQSAQPVVDLPGLDHPRLDLRSISLEASMALTNFKLLVCLLILSESTLAQANCLSVCPRTS
jgi:hypothetical protein